MSEAKKTTGYRGRWAWVDLTNRTVRVEPADPGYARDYVGGRGLQARLLADHLERTGPLNDPLSPAKPDRHRHARPSTTPPWPTAGRGSCSFVGTMARSPEPAAWVPGHKPIYGLVTHSSAGGLFPNMLKRAGFDQVVIDGRADRPVRLEAVDGALPHRRRRGRPLRDRRRAAASPGAPPRSPTPSPPGVKGSFHADRRPGRLEPRRLRLPHRRLSPQLRPRRGRGRLRLEEPRRRHGLRHATP